MFRSSLILLGFVSFAMLVPALRGEEVKESPSLPTVIYKKQDLTTQTALQKPIDISANETPVQDLLQFISDAADVQIYTDPAAFEDLGIDLNEPVTMELKQVPVKQVLDLILTKWGLTYIARENFVLVTDEDELVTRVYPIVDILHAQRQGKDGARFVKDYRQLIIETISPDSWALNGGEGTIAFSPANTSFVITASAKLHARIEALFDDLRSAGVATHDWLEAEGVEAVNWQPTLIGLLSDESLKEEVKNQEAASSRPVTYAPAPTNSIQGGMGGAIAFPAAYEGAATARARHDVARLQAEVEKLKAEIKRLEAANAEDRR